MNSIALPVKSCATRCGTQTSSLAEAKLAHQIGVMRVGRLAPVFCEADAVDEFRFRRDDHAIFPDTDTYNYTIQGYTQNTGSDWLGYVYPNSNGNVPVIQ